MTRQEFDRQFAATENTTEGYSAAHLAQINDYVFALVSEFDLDDDATKSAVDHTFERAFAAADATL